MRRNSTRTKPSGRKRNGNWRIAAPRTSMSSWTTSSDRSTESEDRRGSCGHASSSPSYLLFCAKSLHYLYVDQYCRPHGRNRGPRLHEGDGVVALLHVAVKKLRGASLSTFLNLHTLASQ